MIRSVLSLTLCGFFVQAASASDASAVSAEPPSSKPSLPVSVTISVDAESIEIGKPFAVCATATLVEPFPALVITFESAHGAIRVAKQNATRHTYPAVKQPWTGLSEATIDGPGKAELRAIASVQDDQGVDIYSPAASLYVFATKDRVLTGTKGYLELELEMLRIRLEAGELSNAEYKAAVQRARTGKAATDTKIRGPSLP